MVGVKMALGSRRMTVQAARLGSYFINLLFINTFITSVVNL